MLYYLKSTVISPKIVDVSLFREAMLLRMRHAGELSEAALVKKPSIFEQTSDLRKEMEMTEHHETSQEVADRYSTSLVKGLDLAEVQKVRRKLY